MATRTYGGVTGEERTARRRAALCAAALDLLATGGLERVTVRGVCAAAKLNDRYFYESFRDRDELLLTIRDEVTGQAFRVLLRAIEQTSPDPNSRVRAVVEAVIDFFTEDPRRGRLLIESQSADALRAGRQQTIRTLAKVVADQAAVMLGDHAAPEPDRELAALTLVHGTLELFAGWLRGEVDVSREHLADFLVAMILTTGELSTALRRERGDR